TVSTTLVPYTTLFRSVRGLINKEKTAENKHPRCIYFDGKKNATKILVEKDGRSYPETVKEDHYVMLAEDNSFIGHITVPKPDERSEEHTSELQSRFDL